MSEPESYPIPIPLGSGRRVTAHALLTRLTQAERDELGRRSQAGRQAVSGLAPALGLQPFPPGFLCEVCLDAPAVAFVPAPWGGDMGVCVACAAVGEARHG